jgi:hypothetical protein
LTLRRIWEYLLLVKYQNKSREFPVSRLFAPHHSLAASNVLTGGCMYIIRVVTGQHASASAISNKDMIAHICPSIH